MSYLIAALSGITAFLAGVILGMLHRNVRNAEWRKKQSLSGGVTREYRDFLEYDGSEQN